MWAVILAVVQWLAGRFTPAAKPVATADTAQLATERAANDILIEGARARADADARIMRNGSSDPATVNASPDSPLNNDPDGHYRD